MKIIVLAGDNRSASDIEKVRKAAQDTDIEVYGDGHKHHTIKWLLENDEALKKSLQEKDVLVIILTHGQNIEVEGHKDRVFHASGGYRSTSHFFNALPENIHHILEFACFIGTHDRPYLQRNLGNKTDEIPNEDSYIKAVSNRVIVSSGDSKYPSLSTENINRIIQLTNLHKKYPQWNQNQLMIYDALMNPLSQYISNNFNNPVVAGIDYKPNIVKLPRFLRSGQELKMQDDDKKEPSFNNKLISDFLNQKVEKLLEIFPNEKKFIYEMVDNEIFRNQFYNNFLLKAPYLYSGKDAPDVIAALINMGIDVNVKDFEFRSPLLIACDTLHVETVRLLIQAGSDPNYNYQNGTTPLTNICYNNYKNDETNQKNILLAAELLKSDKLNLNIKDKDNNLPFDLAFDKGNMEIAKLLIQDPRIDLKAQIDLAINSENFEKIKFIINYGIQKESDRKEGDDFENKNEYELPKIFTQQLLKQNPQKFQEECYKILSAKSADFQFEYINLLVKNCTKKNMLPDLEKKLSDLAQSSNFPSADFTKDMDKKIDIPQRTKFDSNPNVKKAELLKDFKEKILEKNINPNPTKPKATAISITENSREIT